MSIPNGYSDPILAASGKAINAALYNFTQNCSSGPVDPGIPLFCNNGSNANMPNCGAFSNYQVDRNSPEAGVVCASSGFAGPDYLTPDNYNLSQAWWFVYKKQWILDLCGRNEAVFDDVWPRFYHFYNHPAGKAKIDSYLAGAGASLPQPCKDALMANYTDAVQRKYGLLNKPDYSTEIRGFALRTPGYIPPPWADVVAQNAYLCHSLADTKFETKFWGDPLWNKNQRDEALYKIMDYAVDGKDFIDAWAQAYLDNGQVQYSSGESGSIYLDPVPHAGEVSWITDPDYSGYLPKLENYAVGTEPWHRVTTDPNVYGYVNNCSDKPILDEIAPYVGGLICAGLGALFVPGDYAKLIGGATAGTAGFLVVQSTVGVGAVFDFKSHERMANASGLLSAGVPAAVVRSVIDMGLIPQSLQGAEKEWGMVAAAAGLGYFAFNPILQPILTDAALLVSLIQLPLASLEWGLTMLFNGCAGHEIFLHTTCLCENANVKPKLIGAMVEDIFGATGQQAAMRTVCMQKAMVKSPWSSDPVTMGDCDSKGHMPNPADCLSAGEYAYERWPKELDVYARPRWESIKHCVDIKNVSFLPPRAIDAHCAGAGKYYRDDGNGNCVNMQLPVGEW